MSLTPGSSDYKSPHYCWLRGYNASSWEHIDECLSQATSCSRCALLLEVIGEIRPGWIDSKLPKRGRIDLTSRENYQDGSSFSLPSLIELFESPLEGESANEDMVFVQSFTYIYQLHGAYHSLMLQLLGC
jgi:hypothetical protein